MSDFLTSLVQRNATQTSLVRPRLPSLFENTGRAAHPALAAPDDGAAGIREEQSFSQVPHPAPNPAAPVTTPAPAQQNIPARPAAVAAQSYATMAPAPHPPAHEREEFAAPDAAASAKAFVQPVSQHEAPPARTVAAAEERQSVRPQIVERPVEHKTEIRAQTFPAEAPRPVAPRETVAAKDPQPQPAAPFAPQPTPEQPRPVASPFEAAPVTPRQPSRAESRRETREAQRAEADPVIHVSIGRIEVRAVEERETRARKSDAPSPVMPLDEYLRSRAKR
jgi:hypothetical protein